VAVATQAVTFQGLLKKIRLRESSASSRAMVGSNFNEAMSALFIGQLL
jgi:hypothetical protein